MTTKQMYFLNKKRFVDVEEQNDFINFLDYDSLAYVFMMLPVPERLMVEEVCSKWKEAVQLAWLDVKKYKCSKTFSYSQLEKLVLYAGKYLEDLTFSSFYNTSIMTKIGNQCKNLKKLEFLFDEVFMCDTEDYNMFTQAFKCLDKIECIKIHIIGNNSSCSAFLFNKTEFQSEMLNSLSKNIQEIHLFFDNKITMRSVQFDLNKFTKLHSLTLRKCKLNNIVQQISKQSSLVYLDLQDSRMTVNKLIFDQLVNLKHINIMNNLSDPNLFTNILNNCRNISFLKIKNNVFVDQTNTTSWVNLKNLIHMDISLHITDDLADKIVNNCKNLKHLDISMHQNSKITKSSLKKLTKLENLEFIKLPQSIKLGNGEFINEISKNCKKLKHLEITSCSNLQDFNYNGLISPAYVFDELSKLKYLEHLNLCDTKEFGNSSIIAISKNCINLKYLDISYCNLITERGLITLTNLKKLENLNVSFINCVTDNFIVQLKGLKVLCCISSKKISDAGIVEFLKNNNHIEKLDLTLCNVTFKMIIAANEINNNPLKNIMSYIEIIRCNNSDDRLTCIKPGIKSLGF